MKKFNLSKLHVHPDNPKSITKVELEKLKNSILTFEKMMEIRPLIYDEDFFVLGGNQKLKALLELGYTEVNPKWVKQVKGLSTAEKKEFIIRDNVQNGHWVMEAFETDYWENTEYQVWLGEDTDGGQIPTPIIGNFNDPGIVGKDQYGVIVFCKNAGEQEKIFNQLTSDGFTCKIVVT